MEAGIVLSGKEARDYNRTHFKLQRKKRKEVVQRLNVMISKIQVSKPS